MVIPGDSKEVPAVASQLSQIGPDGVAEELQSDQVNETAKSQKAGKFRRTALTFFGVRKSMCILPSFFGGRNKNQSRWSSKKGIGKSRTHDGLSKVSDDEALRSGNVSPGDAAGNLHSGCHGECSHPTPDQKSLTLGRQRKGLRSLFQSFRHHRSQRNNDTRETNVASPQCKKEGPVVQCNINRSATECLECDHDVPEFVEDLCDISVVLECNRVDAKALESSVEKETPKSEPQLCDDKLEANLKAGPSGGYDNSSRCSSEPCLKLQTASETPAASSDQLNLIFGEVSSLKSFDSLTGCGDIIADQEDDSITESTVSGERSRNGGKRASCYLTYQGGGEEMAEDLGGTCLQDFWENNTSEAVCCSCDPDQTQMTAELTSSHNVDTLNSSSTQQAGAMDTSSIADVLTPQSEHQESGPNSDEGYYDSTTPGPDEGQEKSGLSFGSTSDPDLETFCEPKEEHLEENKPVALPYKNINSQSEECNRYMEDGQTVCFSQALVDYTKHTQLLCKLGSEEDDLETSSAFTPNMEALPTIVTFDVVDLHNEGEYDEQIQMELEEVASSPYQEFEESYLQKDAYAECDYQMFDLCEPNLISNTWAVATLPRHLSLTRVSQSMSNPLSLDRRSRSLDTDSLELKMPETYRENRPAVASEQDSERNCSAYYRKNVVRDCNNVTPLSWQTRSEVTDDTGIIQSHSQAQVKHKKPQYFCSNVSDGLKCDLVLQQTELYSRQCHLPLQSDSCLPHSTLGMREEESDDVFCKSPAYLHSHSQGSKGRPLAGREITSYAGSPLKSPSFKDETVVLREARAVGDGAMPVTCNNHPEATCN
ncbi:hypothetical protein GOODEAATRI_011750 [Goodea atripinnis]|uniref:APC membrane recruitment protein 1 n=1 Tax=Goodea atripinnis TaxID=208336 RepID=A0ABV0P3L8_9TELE